MFLVLAVAPLSVQAFSFEEFFDDFEEWLSSDEWNFEEGNSSQITNEINVSANTGGNTATEGETIEGKAETSIEIKNIVNGTEIEPVEITSETGEVSVESEIVVDDNVVQIQREIEIDSEKSVESYSVELEGSGCGTDVDSSLNCLGSEEPDINQNWLVSFLESFKNFFQSIFNLF